MRSANSTTERCARSPNVTMRERSEMSISDLMRVTADGSATTVGTLTGSLVRVHPLWTSPMAPHGAAAQLWQDSLAVERIDDGLRNRVMAPAPSRDSQVGRKYTLISIT
jgi:hypothetical protein